MNLEQMQKQLEEIQQMDLANLPPEKLAEIISQLSGIVDKSEETLINTTLIEINQINENEKDNS